MSRVDRELLDMLADHCPIPCTYAGGARGIEVSLSLSLSLSYDLFLYSLPLLISLASSLSLFHSLSLSLISLSLSLRIFMPRSMLPLAPRWIFLAGKQRHFPLLFPIIKTIIPKKILLDFSFIIWKSDRKIKINWKKISRLKKWEITRKIMNFSIWMEKWKWNRKMHRNFSEWKWEQSRNLSLRSRQER